MTDTNVMTNQQETENKFGGFFKKLFPKKEKKPQMHGKRIGTLIFLILWSVYIFIPFYIMFILSVKTQAEANYSSFTWWPQNGFTFVAYTKVFSNNFGGCTVLSGFFNTMLYGIPTVVIGIFNGALQAYAWAKLKWKSGNVIFGYMMFMMMMPDVGGANTSYMMFEAMGWVGTPLPLMIPGMFCGIAQIFFLKQFMATIPDSLIEAAKVDGMGAWGVFFRIVFPLSLPAIGTQLVFCFISNYNSYLQPLIYLDDPSMYTLQIALRFYADTYKNNTPVVMAGSFVACIPTLLLYVCTQQYILKGINMGSGLKL